jgi:hypothetical protein
LPARATLVLLLASLSRSALADPVAFLDEALEVPPPVLVPFAGTTTTVLYLNTDGAEITKVAGGGDAHQNTSPLCGGTFPPFDHTPFGQVRSVVVAELAGEVDKLFSAFNIQVVTTRPAAPPYGMVVIGGQPALCGMAAGYSGLAPLDCGDAWPGDVSFVFSDGITWLPMLAVVVAHEAGHSFGLPHTTESCDVMSNFLCTTGDKGFLDVDAPVAPDHLGKCGLTSTNSHELLLQALGPAPLPTKKAVALSRPQISSALDRARPAPGPLAGPADAAPALDVSGGDGDNGGQSGGCGVGGGAPAAGWVWLLLLAAVVRAWWRQP